MNKPLTMAQTKRQGTLAVHSLDEFVITVPDLDVAEDEFMSLWDNLVLNRNNEEKKKIRDEKKYPDVDQLQAAIHADCQVAKNYFETLNHV